MANKNKTINRLVQPQNPPEAAELTLIPTLTQPVYHRTLETSEKTVDVGRPNGMQRSDGAAEGRSEVRSPGDLINELEFQLEQSRLRQRGLEKELDVREEITSSVTREIREARRQIVTAAAELDALGKDYRAMQLAYEKAAQDTLQLRARAAESEKLASARQARITALESELDGTRTEFADLRTYVEGRGRDWRRFEEQVDRQKRDIERLAFENRELRKSPHSDRESEVRLCRNKIAEQAGELAACRQDLDVLGKDHERLEKYANELRQRLQDQAELMREAADGKARLEEQLETARGTINELTLQVQEEQAAHRSLAGEQELLKEQFEREVRQVRFELTSAQETITEQHDRNERLASDLVDSQEFRRALEAHVGETETRYRLNIERLKRDAKQAREKIAAYERKLRSRDGAIADLMRRLVRRDDDQTMTHELEAALQKIDGYREQSAAEHPTRDRARVRVTRQLIGTADGKEVRFPLFRDRLSIGRTAHNDIQLKTRCVSRRHAVIATDNGRTRVIDWGSRNGVFVNEQRVTERILQSGDVITIGLTSLRYEERSKP